MTFFSLINPCRKEIVFTLLCIFMANIAAMVLPWGIKLIIDDILVTKETDLLHAVMLVLLLALAVRCLFSFLRKYLSSVIGERIVADLRNRIFERVSALSVSSIQEITPSQILTRLTGDVDSIKRFIFGDAIDFIYSFLSVGLVGLALLWINPKLTLLSLLALPLFGFIYFSAVPDLEKRYLDLRDVYGVLTSRINEVLGGILTVRASGMERYEQECLRQRQENMLALSRQAHALNTWLWIGVDFFTSLGILSVLWMGGNDVITGRMTAGELIAFYSYLGMLFAPVVRMVVINSSYREALAALRRIRDVLDLRQGPTEIEHPVVLPVKSGRAVVFENVSFGYTGRLVLKNISFSAAEGETTALVGFSGVGKTTLMSLLLRFFDPSSGKILIGGIDLKDLDLKNHRKETAVVLQDDFLFKATVAENICYGSAGLSKEEMIKAAKAAQAHDFIVGLAHQYDTQIGERGCHLSSGQRQRIAIARALAKKPAVLILDEATSAVDAITENLIQQAVKEFLPEATVFIVAHRFSTIMEADRIIVLEKGRISDQGTHEGLLQKGGFYSDLYREQFKKGDEGVFSET